MRTIFLFKRNHFDISNMDAILNKSLINIKSTRPPSEICRAQAHPIFNHLLIKNYNRIIQEFIADREPRIMYVMSNKNILNFQVLIL